MDEETLVNVLQVKAELKEAATWHRYIPEIWSLPHKSEYYKHRRQFSHFIAYEIE